jgi:hypothetical protein
MITWKVRGWVGFWYARGRRKMQAQLGWTQLRGKDTFESLEIEREREDGINP